MPLNARRESREGLLTPTLLPTAQHYIGIEAYDPHYPPQGRPYADTATRSILAVAKVQRLACHARVRALGARNNPPLRCYHSECTEFCYPLRSRQPLQPPPALPNAAQRRLIHAYHRHRMQHLTHTRTACLMTPQQHPPSPLRWKGFMLSAIPRAVAAKLSTARCRVISAQRRIIHHLPAQSQSSALSVRRSKAPQKHLLLQQRCRPTSAETWLPPLLQRYSSTPH